MRFKTLTAWGLCLLLGVQAAAQDVPAPAVVPFEMLPSNHMVIEAKLNGAGPYRLIFDLGSPVFLLSNRAADASGAVDKSAPKSFLFGVRGEGELKELEAGTLKAEKLPVVVMDHPAVKLLGEAIGKPLDGIIGYTFFARYRTTIDYQKHEMTFVPVKSDVRNLIKDLPNRMMGPKQAKTRVLAPAGLWGLEVGDPEGGVSARGVPVTAVLAGSPAASAGLQVGDVLTGIDGRWTTSRNDALEAAAACAAGKDVAVSVWRESAEKSLIVRPLAGL